MNELPAKPLTAFQALMRAWTELAPYNFIHALRCPGTADAERWREATAKALQSLGLPTAALKIERPAAEIDSHLEAEMNRGFAPGASPLRFFLIETGADEHWFGVVLDHWIADDFSSRALLARIYADYQTTKRAEITWAKQPPRRRNWWLEWKGFFQQAISLRRAVRVPVQEPMDFSVGVFRTTLPDGTLENVRTLAQRQGATVHDVFLAAAAQAGAAAWADLFDERRDSIGMVSAMDLRRFESGQAREAFGLRIGQYTIVESHPEAALLPDLVNRIARKTRALKTLSGRAIFLTGWVFWRLTRSRHGRATLFQRGAPLAVGLSNVNLSESWIETAGIAEFRRCGPTGPIVPLVLMISTLHGRIFVDTTYRLSALTRSAAESWLADFSRRLQEAAVRP